MNEKALIKKCQRGDCQAFEELIRLYYDYVFGFLLKTTTDELMTLAQIAERFGVQPKTIKSRIHDGTVKLRKKLNFKERAEDT